MRLKALFLGSAAVIVLASSIAHAQPISQLPAATSATDADALPATQGGTTRKLTVGQINAGPLAAGAAETARALAAETLLAPKVNGTLTNPTSTGGTFAGGDISGQHVLPTGAINARTTADKLGDLPTPADFLPPGATAAQLYSGAIDAAGPTMAAIAAKGGVLYPCGVYRWDGPVTWNRQALFGMGRACVNIGLNFPSGDVNIFPASSVGSTIDQATFRTLVTRTSGALFHVIGANNTRISNTLAYPAITGTSFYDLLDIDPSTATTPVPADDVLVENFKWSNASQTGLVVRGNSQDIVVKHGSTVNMLHHLYLESGSAITLEVLDLIGATSDGCIISPGASENVNALHMHTVFCDSSYGNNWVFGGSGPITEVVGDGVWGSQAGVTNLYGENPNPNPQHGGSASAGWTLLPSAGFVFTNQNINNVTLTGPEAHLNGGIGFDIQAGHNIKLLGLNAFENTYICYNGDSATCSTHYPGVHVGAAATNVTIGFGQSGSGGLFATQPNQQSYGITVDSGGSAGHVVTLMGNQAPGNLTGGYSVTIGPNDHVVYGTDNLAY